MFGETFRALEQIYPDGARNSFAEPQGGVHACPEAASRAGVDGSLDVFRDRRK